MIKGSELQEATIKVELRDEQEEHSFEVFVPFSNWQQLGVREIRHDSRAFEGRELETRETLEWKGEKVGELSMKLSSLKSKVLVEQMDCLISSEHGIVMSSPS